MIRTTIRFLIPFQHFRLASSSTSSTESSPNRLVNVGSSSSRSQIDAYDDPYVNVNASSSGISTQTTATAKLDVAPSTSSTLSPFQPPISHSVRGLLEPDESKRLRLKRKFDIDDTCSNDAFIFNASLKENPLKINQKTTSVRCNVPK